MHPEYNNQFLQGNFAPLMQEGFFPNLSKVKGSIPKELNGVLYRNGPNPQFPDTNRHWFEGDGMLHAFFIKDGRISYSNKWINTERFKLEKKANKALFYSYKKPSDPQLAGVSFNTANTNIIRHAGKLLALQERSCPVEINPQSLETIGDWDAEGKVQKLSAHPRFDHTTNEMHHFAYTPGTNEIIYYLFNHKGEITNTENISAPFSSFLHDFLITENYVIFPVLPLTFNFNRPPQGKPLIMWEEELGAHIGVMKRSGKRGEVQWLTLNAFHAFHFMNAYEDGDRIYVDGMKSTRAHLFPNNQGNIPNMLSHPPTLTRWTLDLKQQKIFENQLDSYAAEFPRFDERFTGRSYQHGFVAANLHPSPSQSDFDAIIHYDLKNQSKKIRHFGMGNTVSEPVFVPRNSNSLEGDGYIFCVIYDAKKNSSDLYLLDAMNIDQDPIAIVSLPNRIPNGFHGNWYD